ALWIPFLTNPAERFLNGPERLAIVALQNLSEMIRIEHAFGQFVREHGIEKFSRPWLALHDQINRQRLQFGREFRVFAEKNVRKFWIFYAPQGGEDTPIELRRAG